MAPGGGPSGGEAPDTIPEGGPRRRTGMNPSTGTGPSTDTGPTTGTPPTHRTAGWLRPLIARPDLAHSALFWTGAVLVAASAAIHLHLWSTGYRHIATIGPLFLLQGVAGLLAAVAVAVTRHWLVATAAAGFVAGTIGGLLLSVEVGLFGFRDSLSAPYATSSLIIEIAAVVVLVAAAGTSPGRPGHQTD